MSTLRLLLPVTALLLTPALVACDAKPEPEPAGGTTEDEAADTTEGEPAGDDTTEGQPPKEEPAPEAVECDDENIGAKRACEGGVQYCATDFGWPDAQFFWGTCVEEVVCEPGATRECGECVLDGNGEPWWEDTCGQDGGTSTPLVLSFDGAGVRFDSRVAAFDLGPQCGATDWVDAATPWLALDRDGSGAIEGGHELFGSATRLHSGVRAEHGFAALAELDADRDGKISEGDPDFARLLLWADHDGDRRSTGWELQPAASAGLVSIALTYARDRRCDARDNCEIERAAFVYRDAAGRTRTGEVVDVHFACQ